MGDDMNNGEAEKVDQVELGEGRLVVNEDQIGHWSVLYGDELGAATGDFAFGHQRGRGDVIKLSGKWYQVGPQIRINQPVEVYFEGVQP